MFVFACNLQDNSIERCFYFCNLYPVVRTFYFWYSKQKLLAEDLTYNMVNICFFFLSSCCIYCFQIHTGSVIIYVKKLEILEA